MSPELAAILGVGAFLFSLQVPSTLWSANVIGLPWDALRAAIRAMSEALRAVIAKPGSKPTSARQTPLSKTLGHGLSESVETYDSRRTKRPSQ